MKGKFTEKHIFSERKKSRYIIAAVILFICLLLLLEALKKTTSVTEWAEPPVFLASELRSINLLSTYLSTIIIPSHLPPFPSQVFHEKYVYTKNNNKIELSAAATTDSEALYLLLKKFMNSFSFAFPSGLKVTESLI